MILFCPFLGISCYFKVQNANTYVFLRFSVKIFLYCNLNTFHNLRPTAGFLTKTRVLPPKIQNFLNNELLPLIYDIRGEGLCEKPRKRSCG
jgi:hypothetical protein